MSTDGKTGPIARSVMFSISIDLEAEADYPRAAVVCSSEWLEDCYTTGALPPKAIIYSVSAWLADNRKHASGEP